ncbi:MAG: response regulator [Chloroflexi bacterium]|nr:MAG: response regulator [Chloroflexota bacterium]
MTAVDLNQLVHDFQDMLRRLIGEDILLQVRAAENLPPIQADRSQIEQVLLNLAVNARDAMPNGGELVIETGAVTLDEVYTATHPGIEPGRYVLLAVSDTGVGMDAETRQRIFEPFFTTKRKGEGTGLGLATVYNIIRHHRGSIWVYSEPGQGTVFKIYLPTAEQVEKAEAEAPEAAPPGQGETILVVEDEAAVRQLVAETLQAHGYTVLSAEHPARAVEQVRGRSQPVDLLLTDVVMPSMNGMELYRRLAEIWPEMKVLYMSGYTDNAVVQHGILQEGLAFLQKPFTIPDLLRRVRQTLESQLPQ